MGAPSPAASRPVSASRKDSAILLEASRRAERQKASSRHGDSRGPGAVRAWQSAAEDGTRCDDFDSRMGDKGHEMNREVLPPPDEESQCGSDGGTATREKVLRPPKCSGPSSDRPCGGFISRGPSPAGAACQAGAC